MQHWTVPYNELVRNPYLGKQWKAQIVRRAPEQGELTDPEEGGRGNRYLGIPILDAAPFISSLAWRTYPEPNFVSYEGTAIQNLDFIM